MRRHALPGLVLAALAALLVLLSDALGLDVEGVALLGAALGAVVGLVPDRSPAQRVGAFGVGFAAAWVGYLLRAAFLPDAASGRAVAVLVVLLVCLVVAGTTAGRLPLWATLVGAAAMVGSYESAYTLDPSSFVSTSPASATAVLVCAAGGFLATVLLGAQIERDRAHERGAEPVALAQHAVEHPAEDAAPALQSSAPVPAAATNGTDVYHPRAAATSSAHHLDRTPEA